MSNFRDMSEHFLQQQAAVRVENWAELGSELVRMFHDPDRRQRIGNRGYAILMANRGAADRIVDRIALVEDRRKGGE
jgi:3-deoxy-D-manno-octulosonic-acid transferase